jgi:hypothetical protein
MAAWCERWNIKINEDKTRAIYFSHQQRPPNSLLMLNGQNIPFVNSVKYLGIIFYKRITWRLQIETIEDKAFRIFLTLYSLFKSERLNAGIKLMLHRALIRSLMTYACPAWELEAEIHLLKLQRLQNRVLCTNGKFPKTHIGPRYACGFPNSIRLWFHNKIMEEASRSHPKSLDMVQGGAQHTKYKRLKLGGGHLYDCSRV